MSSHPIDVHVGKRLRLRRTILGMSQEAIGNAIGVTFQQIQKYERGINRMGASRLYEFSKVLGVPVSYFFEGMDDPATKVQFEMKEDGVQEFAHDPMTSRETLELVRAYYKIKEAHTRKKIGDLIKSIAENHTIPEEQI